MSRHLSLIESDFQQMEQQVLPRFPFCYLVFKEQESQKVFEVKDISASGMQLCLKSGEHIFAAFQKIGGTIHWLGESIDISGDIQWIKQDRIGLEFTKSQKLQSALESFLSMDNFARALKPIHQLEYSAGIPQNLKYWLRSDGPVELFVWTHQNGSIEKFQFLIMENFIEWENGSGLRSGRVISKRNIETPLVDSDEFVFHIDNILSDERMELVRNLCTRINQTKIESDILDFIKLKLDMSQN